jgi:hypothetical protein
MNYSEFIYPAIIILALHWYCDFVLQTRWQAENKSKNNMALTLHVGSYSLGILLFLLYFYLCGANFTITGIFIFAGLNGTLHWCTDFVTSRCTSYLWQKKDVHGFFAVIGIDQFIHSATLLSTIPFLQS